MCKEEDNSTAYTKVINSETASYRPILTDTLVLDAVPTVNSFNSVTSDAVARAVAGASGEVPQVTENDNGKVLKAIYDAGGPAVEWGEATVDQTYDATSTNAQSGVAVAQAISAVPTYTAGDGIAFTANEVSVKAGNGLSIGDVTSSGTQTMTSTRLAGDDTAKYVGDLCTLTSDLLSQITNGGLSITTSTWFSLMTPAYASTAVYAAICNFDDARSEEFGSNLIYKQYVMGAVSYAYDGVNVIDQNTGVTFDSADYQSSLSNLTLQEIQANPSNYYLAIIQRYPAFDEAVGHTAYFSMWKDVWRSNWGTPAPTSYDTATYTGTVTIQDALNVANPLPASAVGDAGKVLTVNNAGAAEWATPAAGDEVPTVTSNDNGKVLTASYSGGSGSYAWAPPSGGGSSYSAGDGIAISTDTISAKVDGTTITNQKSTWAQTSQAGTVALLIQDSCDNTSSLLIGTSNYDYSTEAWVLDWTLSLWRSGQQPRSAGFYRLDLKSDSTWVIPSGWDANLDHGQVKLFAASTDGTTMGTPIALPLYNDRSTASSAWIRYDRYSGTTLPRYVYVYLTDADVTSLLTCNTLNFGVQDRYGTVTTMLTTKPAGAELDWFMSWPCYEHITGQLGLYDSNSSSYSVRIPKSYNYDVTWGDMYDVLQQVRNVSVGAGNVATFYLDYNTSYGGTSYKIPDTWGVGVFLIELLISDQSGVAPTKGWNIQVSYADNDGNEYNLYRQTIPADANPLASTNKLALSIPVMCQNITSVIPDNASHFYTFRVDLACADTSLAYSYSARLSATGGVRENS